MSIKSYKFVVSGKVQGVYYRVNIKKNASASGFSGYVKNKADGTVEAAVSCTDAELDQFVTILKNGSPKSKVVDIQQLDCEEKFSGSFQIR